MVLAEPGIFWEHSHEHRSVLKEPAGCTSKAGCLKTEGPAPSRRILLRLRDGVTERHFCHHLWTARLATLSEGKPTDPLKMLSSETSSCLQRSNSTDGDGRCLYTLLIVSCVCPAMLSVIYPRAGGGGFRVHSIVQHLPPLLEGRRSSACVVGEPASGPCNHE